MKSELRHDDLSACEGTQTWLTRNTKCHLPNDFGACPPFNLKFLLPARVKFPLEICIFKLHGRENLDQYQYISREY
jgi:hypothetical protein